MHSREKRIGRAAFPPRRGRASSQRIVPLLLALLLPCSAQAAGELDASFGVDGFVRTNLGAGDQPFASAIDAEGRIVVAGIVYPSSLTSDFAVVRYETDGTLDESFGAAGKVILPIGTGTDNAFAVAIDPAGRVLVAGSAGRGDDQDFALVRLREDGTLDPTFGNAGKVMTDFGAQELAVAMAIDAGGRIVLGGMKSVAGQADFAIARYDSSGALDGAFGNGGKVVSDLGFNDVVKAMAIDGQGRIVLAGGSYSVGNFELARFLSTGAPDSSFGSGGRVVTDLGANDMIWAVAVDASNRVVVAGARGYDFALARYDASGALDATFGSGGTTITDFGGTEWALSMAIDHQARIVVAGYSRSTDDDQALARYDSSGVLDPTFGEEGVVIADFGAGEQGRSISIDGRGRLVVTGHSASASGYDFAVARYLGDACGNGARESGEECDDGGTVAGDGCSAACQDEGDRDADGIPDEPHDWCVNVGGSQDFLDRPTPKLTVKGLAAGTNAYDAISFSGEFRMPVGFDFATFDPNAADTDGSRGIQVLLTNRAQSQRWGAPLAGIYAGPGTVGWVRDGRSWAYYGMPGNLMGNGGVTRLTLTDRGSGSVRVRATVRNATPAYPIDADQLPIEVTVVMGRREGAAQRGECGETRFTASQCKLNTSGTKVTCKG